MDTYAGNNQDPLSLHKYLYCQADPVDNTDPSGNESIDYFVAVENINTSLRTTPDIRAAQDAFSTDSKGGPDITVSLNRTLDNVAQTFGAWLYDTALASGKQLLPGNGGVGLGAWDIPALRAIGADKKNELGWGRTVTFYGVTYYGSAANYALWGKAFRLCHDRLGSIRWNLTTAIFIAASYKTHYQDGLNLEGQEALWFVEYGYNGTLPPVGGVPGRTPNKEPIGNYRSQFSPNAFMPDDTFNWKWLPGKNY
jgi:hypothetical protein